MDNGNRRSEDGDNGYGCWGRAARGMGRMVSECGEGRTDPTEFSTWEVERERGRRKEGGCKKVMEKKKRLRLQSSWYYEWNLTSEVKRLI